MCASTRSACGVCAVNRNLPRSSSQSSKPGSSNGRREPRRSSHIAVMTRLAKWLGHSDAGRVTQPKCGNMNDPLPVSGAEGRRKKPSNHGQGSLFERSGLVAHRLRLVPRRRSPENASIEGKVGNRRRRLVRYCEARTHIDLAQDVGVLARCRPAPVEEMVPQMIGSETRSTRSTVIICGCRRISMSPAGEIQYLAELMRRLLIWPIGHGISLKFGAPR